MKYYGNIGYLVTHEEMIDDEETGEMIPTGNWIEEIVERPYTGDVIRNRSKRGSGTGVNDDINVSKSISIISDPFAYQNFMNIAYVTWMGTKWKVTDVEPEYPRLILDIGGVFNENSKIETQ